MANEEPISTVKLTCTCNSPLRQAISLLGLQNLCFLYAYYEDEITSWHPLSLRTDPRCESLRTGLDNGNSRYTYAGFAEGSTATQSVESLKSFLLGDKNNPPVTGATHDSLAINIIYATDSKLFIVEFRQYVRTFTSLELQSWIRFCANLLRCADLAAKINFNFIPPQGTDYFMEPSILDYLFLRGKFKDFLLQKRDERRDES
ncbi:hypothetical protein B7494_g8564 [Chlorociboria aeruginascens]|nr:hypothetical protein B7494_g8564 [Chlorociboria aeruginascens]